MSHRLALLFVVLLAGAVLIAGCEVFGILDGSDAPPENFSGQHIETAKETYQWEGDSLAIKYTYTNRFDETVFMAGCADGSGSSFIFEKRTENGWKTAHHRVCLLRLVAPTAIEPGETYEATFELDERKVEGRVQPSWKADSVPGTYRVREPMYWTWDEEKHTKGTLETGIWLSNEFEIQ